MLYVKNLLDWVDFQFKDPYLFPNYDGAYYSRSKFIPVVKDIMRRLIRVFAHILYHHFDIMSSVSLDADFVAHLQHFLALFDRYDLLVEKDFKVITHSVQWLQIQSNQKYK